MNYERIALEPTHEFNTVEDTIVSATNPIEAKLHAVNQDYDAVMGEIQKLREALVFREQQALQLQGAKNVLESILREGAGE